MTAVPENPYEGLRKLALGTSRASLKIDEPGPVFGVLMETGYPKAVVTLACFLTGSASLYFSNGGGMLGGGEHRAVAEAAKVFVRECGGFLGKMERAADCPLPAAGGTIFYALTDEGTFCHCALEDDLGRKRSEFSPLFYAGQDVITRTRLLQG
jgi:hypothetical protein